MKSIVSPQSSGALVGSSVALPVVLLYRPAPRPVRWFPCRSRVSRKRRLSMRHVQAFATFALVLAVVVPAVAGDPLAIHVTGSTPKSPSKAAQEELRAKKAALRVT